MLKLIRAHSNRIKIQFSTKRLGGIKETSLRLLSPLGTKERAWHAKYKCTGIYHCEFTHPDILCTCTEYDRPTIETINRLRKRAGRQSQPKTIPELLRQHTEAFFNAFIHLWQREPCQDPNTLAYTCLDQRPCVSIMNGIEWLSCSARTEDEHWHRAMSIRPDYARIEIKYLRFLTRNYGRMTAKRDCTYAGNTNH
ncbi:hypothetical protein GcM3_101021 [Golovinomyces cichoracearum]|uniref:Uncharacterized protein n=1 Tax=Golovinomyces cichoracearum TaxID=62708 RepID=A0A420IAD1_9PEZI|nr:hypothetical protein GcM3_101021 [Golovinomyces cichoracearum]